MKTLKKINNLLTKFEKVYDYDLKDATQGSIDWFNIKLGVISASNASKVVAKSTSQTRSTYMNELIAQICTGYSKDINTKYMDWGHQHEDAARASYEFETGKKIVEVPFVFKDDSFREGCSPDGLVQVGKKLTSGLEIKCPYTTEVFIDFLVNEAIKPEYKWQLQYTMRVLECEVYEFGQFDPRMNATTSKFREIESDEKMQKTLNDAVPQFISEMNIKLKAIGIEFGSHWHRLAKQFKKAS